MRVGIYRGAGVPLKGLRRATKGDLKRGSSFTYLWLVGNGGMVVIVVIILPHSSIPY